MRFLRAKSNGLLVAVTLIVFSLKGWPIRAAETTNRVVVTAEDVDLAKTQSGGQIVYVSSGQRPAVSHAIDDDRRTVFLFSSSDPRPTVIIKLTQSRVLHRVSVVVGSEAGKVDVYLLDEIRGDGSDLDKLKPVGSIVDLGIAREAVVDFAPRNARYVALRWALPKNYSRPLAIAEIGVFSNADPSAAGTLVASDPPPPNAVEGPPLIVSVSP
jgi:hypothetical protein